MRVLVCDFGLRASCCCGFIEALLGRMKEWVVLMVGGGGRLLLNIVLYKAIDVN